MTAQRPPMLAADHIRELTQPYATHTVIPADGDESPSRVHTVHHASLLNQLRNATSGATNLSDSDASRSIAASKPAAHLEALDVIARIDSQSRNLALSVEAGEHRNLEERLLAISGKIGDETHFRVRSWWAAARLTTHHDAPPIRPYGVPCPECSETGSLRIRLDDEIASCTECGQVWDRTGGLDTGSLDILGQHVSWCTEHAITKARHWDTDDDGYPIECTKCLVFREEYAMIRHAKANALDKESNCA